MTTSVELLPPRSLPPDDWVAQLRSALDVCGDLVAAYYLTARYADPPVLQDELHLELAEPPDAYAPAALFRDFAHALPSGQVFTFSTTAILARVQAAGFLLRSRAESG